MHIKKKNFIFKPVFTIKSFPLPYISTLNFVITQIHSLITRAYYRCIWVSELPIRPNPISKTESG